MVAAVEGGELDRIDGARRPQPQRVGVAPCQPMIGVSKATALTISRGCQMFFSGAASLSPPTCSTKPPNWMG